VGPVSLGRVQINGSQHFPSFYFSGEKKKWDKTLKTEKKMMRE
jgi:predicted RNA-binding protein